MKIRLISMISSQSKDVVIFTLNSDYYYLLNMFYKNV